MTAIRVICRSCGAEVNSAEVNHDMLCTVCLARELATPLLAEYRRLWAKRSRYLRGRVALDPVQGQLARVVQRIARHMHDRIRNPQLAIATLSAALEEARRSADSVGGRILVPRHGQEIVGEGARA